MRLDTRKLLIFGWAHWTKWTQITNSSHLYRTWTPKLLGIILPQLRGVVTRRVLEAGNIWGGKRDVHLGSCTTLERHFDINDLGAGWGSCGSINDYGGSHVLD